MLLHIFITCVFVTGAAFIKQISQDVSITDNTFLSNVAPLGSGGAIFTDSITGTRTTSPNTFGTGPQANLPQDVFPPP